MREPESVKSRERLLRGMVRPYFKHVCSAILDPYLEAQGFQCGFFGIDRLSYRRGGCVLEFGYVPSLTDRQPRYAVTAAIGDHRGWFRRARKIGLWQVPSSDRGSKRWQWEFRGPEQLKRELKVLVRLLDAYARPLWEDEKRLHEVLQREWPIYLEMANR